MNTVLGVRQDVAIRDVERSLVSREFQQRLQAEFESSGAAALMGEIKIADHLPALVDLYQGPGGRIVVARGAGTVDAFNPAGDSGEPIGRLALWDVFSPDGTFLGAVKVPDDVAFAAARGTRAVGIGIVEDNPVVRIYALDGY